MRLWTLYYKEQKVIKCYSFGGHAVKLFKYKLIYFNDTYIQKIQKTIAVYFSDLTQSKYTQETTQIKK